MPIVRNSFIQMSKLTNVTGRIGYISSSVRQENLYAVYETVEEDFWTELAKCNQEEFKKSGTVGKCIEARELIIALPESFVEYEPNKLLKLFTEHFKQNYGTECVAALHHNKRKTNYHIHLIFSERKLLDEPIEKIAKRNMFYDENGKHVRTKKEVLDEAGQIRKGCKIIQRGEVYERKIFSIKDSNFKSEKFLDDVKQSYTNLINIYIKDDAEKLKVFDKNGVYLPMKKIGKNNPKAEQIEADNQMRMVWNQTVDRALFNDISEMQILGVKQSEIGQKAKNMIQQSGKNPELFKSLIVTAVYALELMISKKLKEKLEKIDKGSEVVVKDNMARIDAEHNASMVTEPVEIQKMPVKSVLASRYLKLSDIFKKLEKQNAEIYAKEQELAKVEQEIVGVKGFFKGKLRKQLREQADLLKIQIDGMKRCLPRTVQGYGYETVQEFLAEYKVAKVEYSEYQVAVAKWEEQTGKKMEDDSLKAKLQKKHREVRSVEKQRQGYRNNRSERRL